MRRGVASLALVGLLLLVPLVRARSEEDSRTRVERLARRSRATVSTWPAIASAVHREAARRDFALAPTASYSLTWWTVDSGGWTSSRGGEYSLGATIGQPDVNVLHGGEYTLAGGFWPGGEMVTAYRVVYLPIVLRNR